MRLLADFLEHQLPPDVHARARTASGAMPALPRAAEDLPVDASRSFGRSKEDDLPPELRWTLKSFLDRKLQQLSAEAAKSTVRVRNGDGAGRPAERCQPAGFHPRRHGDAPHRHRRGHRLAPAYPELLVTAAVDGLQFLHPIKVGDLIILHARVTRRLEHVARSRSRSLLGRDADRGPADDQPRLPHVRRHRPRRTTNPHPRPDPRHRGGQATRPRSGSTPRRAPAREAFAGSNGARRNRRKKVRGAGQPITHHRGGVARVCAYLSHFTRRLF